MLKVEENKSIRINASLSSTAVSNCLFSVLPYYSFIFSDLLTYTEDNKTDFNNKNLNTDQEKAR